MEIVDVLKALKARKSIENGSEILQDASWLWNWSELVIGLPCRGGRCRGRAGIGVSCCAIQARWTHGPDRQRGRAATGVAALLLRRQQLSRGAQPASHRPRFIGPQQPPILPVALARFIGRPKVDGSVVARPNC